MSSEEFIPVRYPPGEGESAYLCIEPDDGDFRNDIQAMIMNESYGGCGLMMAETDLLQEGDRCLAKIGSLTPMSAEVAWRVADGNGILRIGLKYND